jgi:ABC-type polysaccharide/polyol phosphate transport system ATPase subunit
MNASGIEVVDLWKKFRRGEVHDSLRDLVPALAGRLRRRPATHELTRGDFWAVRGLSFHVEPGDALGIIGPNGAGKSTVLKLLTQILRPTRGEIRVHGRVGALIEIAAGFHSDLTGRENVFLQGAIMGMQRAEIARKFDEIVDFAGIPDFIDTPVKRYSSGMNARLGFAIAAHLEPDVLIIDEVLAVGDFGFQEKAFTRIREIATAGVPVVVVSHQLDRIAALCNRALLLDRGAPILQGSPSECIARYVLGTAESSGEASPEHPIRLHALTIDTGKAVRSGDRLRLTLEGEVAHRRAGVLESVEIRVRALQTGELVYATSTDRMELELPERGPFRMDLSLQMNVPVGVYSIESVIYDQRRQRAAAQGPFRTVEVIEGTRFWGSVQLNAQMDLTAPGAEAEALPRLRSFAAPPLAGD